jgi:Phosphotransferase enzyme family
MSQHETPVGHLTRSLEVREALESLLSDYYGAPRGIAQFRQRPSEYQSSFALEELELVLEDGTPLQLMLKNLGELLEPARCAKPEFLINPLREIEAYRRILSPDPLGTAECYGSVVDPAFGVCWLFLEKVRGVELYQVGDLSVWEQAARWLAKLHVAKAWTVNGYSPALPLLRYDADFYRLWLERASRSPASAKSGHLLERLAERYDRVIKRLCELPVTFIHGEFYPSNVLIQQTGPVPRVCPIDWEMAAAGPGLVDLAALTSGNWCEEEKHRLALSYYAGLEEGGVTKLPLDEFLNALDYCRLQLAIQWLGWSGEWTPPPDHVHDWLSEARLMAERLGL